jgi:molecular chaperone DnaJ
LTGRKIVPTDYYIVLGVSRGADLKRIKKAYRSVVKECHPDATQTQESAEKFREIREAYETLSDEEKRRKYDKELEKQGSEISISRVPETVERRRSLFDEMEHVFSSSVDDFFEGFLPGFFDAEKGGIRGKDLYYEAVLSPGEAASGGLFPIIVPVLEPCPRCKKSGFWEDFFCPVCLGYGRVRSEREFSLSIPPHVRHGTEIRVSMEDIGLRDVYLNIVVIIDPGLEEEESRSLTFF